MPLFANKKGIYFTGKESLLNRPFKIYEDIFKKNNVIFKKIDGKIYIQNELQANTYEVLGNISSQFISGLLFSLPLKKSDSIIKIIGNLESKKYVDMTIDVLKEFGISISKEENVYYIKGNQKYLPSNYKVESDYSQLAFFAVAGIINGDIAIQNLNTESLQPDFEIINLIEKMGGKIIKEKNIYKFIKSETNGINIDVSQNPDIAPILSILAAVSKGETCFENAQRLRYKETDRLKATSESLNLLGVKCKVKNDSFTVHGQNILQGNSFSSYNDHRMVMSISIAALRANSPITIEGAQAVNKSYPDFFEDLKSLGVKIEYL
jgi:3-phosphoshikimate 1-carboxyvinyltransferase